MLYKFKSKAAGDVIMTEPVGDSVLRAMGREPASQGIFESGSMATLLQTLEAAVAADEAHRQRVPSEESSSPGRAVRASEGVSLKQRAWPLVEMMRRAIAAREDIVWGV
jgi:hypothetical protein